MTVVLLFLYRAQYWGAGEGGEGEKGREEEEGQEEEEEEQEESRRTVEKHKPGGGRGGS